MRCYKVGSFPLEVLQSSVWFPLFPSVSYQEYKKVANLGVKGEATKLHVWAVHFHIHCLLEKQPCPIDCTCQVQVFTLGFCLQQAIQRLNLYSWVWFILDRRHSPVQFYLVLKYDIRSPHVPKISLQLLFFSDIKIIGTYSRSEGEGEKCKCSSWRHQRLHPPSHPVVSPHHVQLHLKTHPSVHAVFRL